MTYKFKITKQNGKTKEYSVKHLESFCRILMEHNDKLPFSVTIDGNTNHFETTESLDGYYYGFIDALNLVKL